MGVKIDDPRRDSETIDVEHTVSRRLDSTNLFDAPIADRNITDERRHAGTVVNASAFENQVVHVFTSNGLIWRSTFHTARLFDCARLYDGKPRRATAIFDTWTIPSLIPRSLPTQTFCCKVCNARKTNSRLNSFSLSAGNSGLPVGLVMPPEAMARNEPTSLATGIIVQICVTGISSFSISLLIAAPQRVLEPQVDVRITPLTPAAFSRWAIWRPMPVAFSTAA